MHMVRVFEDAGAGAVHIEDQLLPKKCGHLNDKKLADAARHGRQGRRRRERRAAHLVIDRAHRCGRSAKAWTARSRAPSSISRPAPTRSSPRRSPTPRCSARFAKRDAGRAAARQHDRVRHARRSSPRPSSRQMGYKMVIWPVVARCGSPARRRQQLYAAISARRRHAQHARPRCRRAPSSTTLIGLHAYEALDHSIRSRPSFRQGALPQTRKWLVR